MEMFLPFRERNNVYKQRINIEGYKNDNKINVKSMLAKQKR